MEAVISGEKIIKYDKWPEFMYSEEGVLCKGELMFQVFEEMFMGSSEGFRRSSVTKKCVAEKAGITKITPEILSYVVIQVSEQLSAVAVSHIQ